MLYSFDLLDSPHTDKNILKRHKRLSEASVREALHRSPVPVEMFNYLTPRDEQESHLELSNDIIFPINISIIKVIPDSFPGPIGDEMRLTSCPGIHLIAIDPCTQSFNCGSTVHLGKSVNNRL